jgi:hypothetical protein
MGRRRRRGGGCTNLVEDFAWWVTGVRTLGCCCGDRRALGNDFGVICGRLKVSTRSWSSLSEGKRRWP